MGLYGSNRRGKGRAKREISVTLKRATEQKQVYTIDFSQGGVKVGGAMLRLAVGEPVELVVEKNGSTFTFSGRVEREDGIHRINRIGRDVSSYLIKIVDERFVEFVKQHFSV